jgi:GTP1/Obg family GTP-binding protein
MKTNEEFNHNLLQRSKDQSYMMKISKANDLLDDALYSLNKAMKTLDGVKYVPEEIIDAVEDINQFQKKIQSEYSELRQAKRYREENPELGKPTMKILKLHTKGYKRMEIAERLRIDSWKVTRAKRTAQRMGLLDTYFKPTDKWDEYLEWRSDSDGKIY